MLLLCRATLPLQLVAVVVGIVGVANDFVSAHRCYARQHTYVCATIVPVSLCCCYLFVVFLLIVVVVAL